MNLPNRLTVMRLFLTLVFVALMSIPHVASYIVAYAVFAVASITDYYDGKIARQRGLVTNFGKLFDPVADKVLLCSGFVMLMGMPELAVPAWTVVAVLAREFLVTGARSLAATEGTVIAASFWGKLKTTIQMVYVFVILFFAILIRIIERWISVDALALSNRIVAEASCWGMVIVAVVTVYSGIEFARASWRQLGLGADL